MLLVASYDFTGSVIVHIVGTEYGLGIVGTEGANFFKSLQNLGVISRKSISALMSITALVCSGRICRDTNSSKRSVKAGYIFHFHGQTGSIGVSAEVFQ